MHNDSTSNRLQFIWIFDSELFTNGVHDTHDLNLSKRPNISVTQIIFYSENF